MKNSNKNSSCRIAAAPLTVQEVQNALQPLSQQYPPLLSLEQAAVLSHYTPGSLRKLVSQERFPGSAIRGPCGSGAIGSCWRSPTAR